LEVIRGSGQLYIASGVNIVNFRIFADYEYYTVGLYVEDVIEAILLAVDEYNNYPITAANLQTTYQLVEGTGVTDTMTPNYTTTSDGYAVGRVWYLDYDNVVTTLVAGNFTIGGGGVFQSFDKRNGRLILAAAISTSASVVCTYNYVFKTLQTTEITIPYAWFRPETVANRMEAINQVLKVVAPNYCLYTRGTAHIWARYLTQKTAYDSKIYNPKILRYYPDSDVFTRVKMIATNKRPKNITSEATLTNVGMYLDEKKTGQVLRYVGLSGKYIIYRFPEGLSIVDSQSEEYKVKVYINEARLCETSTYIDHVVITNRRKAIVMLPGGSAKIFVPHKYLCPDSKTNSFTSNIRFYTNKSKKGDKTTGWLIGISVTSVNAVDGIVYISGKYSDIQLIDNACYYVRYSTGADSGSEYYVDYTHGLVGINKIYLREWKLGSISGDERITADYYAIYQRNYSSRKSLNASVLVDGNPNTQYQKLWAVAQMGDAKHIITPANPSNGSEIFTLSFTELKTVDTLDIGMGYFKPLVDEDEDNRKFPITATMSLRYSTEKVFVARTKLDINATQTTMSFEIVNNMNDLNVDDILMIDGEEIQVKSFSITDMEFNITNCVRGVNSTRAVAHRVYTTNDYENIVAMKKINFSEMCRELTAFELSSGDILTVTKESFGPNFQFATLLLLVHTIEPLQFRGVGWIMQNPDADAFVGIGTEDQDITVYPVAINNLSLYENAVLISEAKLIAGTPTTDLQVHDTFGLLDTVGDKVYINELDEKVVIDKEELDVFAYNTLLEGVKAHTQIKVEELFNPVPEVGMTVLVVDTLNGISQNYFVEEASGANTNGKVSHSFALARYP
jgi:hypothetical protein